MYLIISSIIYIFMYVFTGYTSILDPSTLVCTFLPSGNVSMTVVGVRVRARARVGVRGLGLG